MNERGLKNSDLIIATVISVVIILFARLGLLNSINAFISESFENIQYANFSIFSNIKDDFSFLADLAGNKDSIDQYKNENEFYKAENERQRLELESLRKILDQSSFDKDYKTIPARVLTYMETGNMILINKGDADNVKVGSAVTKGGCFIGRVSKTYPSSALVELPFSPNIRVPVIFPDSGARGFIVGADSRIVYVVDIPNSLTLPEGSTVVTSGADSQTPYGLLVGKSSGAFSNQTDISQRVQIESTLSLNQLTEVFVIEY